MDHLPDILTSRLVDLPIIPFGIMVGCDFLEPPPPSLSLGKGNIERYCSQSRSLFCRPLPLSAPHLPPDCRGARAIYTEILKDNIFKYRLRSVNDDATAFIPPRTGPPLVSKSDLRKSSYNTRRTREIEDHCYTLNSFPKSSIPVGVPPGKFEIQFAKHNHHAHPRILFKRINTLYEQQHEPPDVLAKYAWNVDPPGSHQLRRTDFLTSESIHYLEPSLPPGYLSKKYFLPPPATQARNRINKPPNSFLAAFSGTREWLPPPLSAIKLLGILPDRLWPLKVRSKCTLLITEQENSGEYYGPPQCSSGTTPLLHVQRKAFIFKEHPSRLFQHHECRLTRRLSRNPIFLSNTHGSVLKPWSRALRVFLKWQYGLLNILINSLDMKKCPSAIVLRYLNRIRINFAKLNPCKFHQTRFRGHKNGLKCSIHFSENESITQFFQTGCRTLSKIGQAT